MDTGVVLLTLYIEEMVSFDRTEKCGVVVCHFIVFFFFLFFLLGIFYEQWMQRYQLTLSVETQNE